MYKRQGGQSLIATLNMRLSHPSILIDLNGISDLANIDAKGGVVEIGAMVRQATAMRSEVITTLVPLMAMALPYVAHPAIRNRGSIGGSIAFADPAAELPACFLALGGEAVIAGPAGTRRVQADEYFRTLYETSIGPNEVLTAVRIPAATTEMRYGFAELSRRHGDYAIAGLAASARAAGNGLTDVRLAYFGVAMTPVRARRAEAAVAAGQIDEAVKALASDLDPPDDIQETGAVKKHLAGVLLRRVCSQLTGNDA